MIKKKIFKLCDYGKIGDSWEKFQCKSHAVFYCRISHRNLCKYHANNGVNCCLMVGQHVVLKQAEDKFK